MKLLEDECHKTPLMVKLTLVQVMVWWRQEQAITRANIDIVLCHLMASLGHNGLTHWGRVTHICVSKLPTIGSDNGLWPGRRQAITWTNAGVVIIGPLWTNFSEILIEIPISSLKKMRLKESSVKWRPCCLGLDVLSSLRFQCLCHNFRTSAQSEYWDAGWCNLQNMKDHRQNYICPKR